MAYLFDDFQKFGQEHLEVVGKSSSSLAESWLAMRDSDTEWHIGETMAVVLRERLMELEALEATGKATEDTVSRLAFVRKLLVQFDAKDGHAASIVAYHYRCRHPDPAIWRIHAHMKVLNWLAHNVDSQASDRDRVQFSTHADSSQDRKSNRPAPHLLNACVSRCELPFL